MIRFYNGKILTTTDMRITDAEVWTDGDRIVYFGKNPKT